MKSVQYRNTAGLTIAANIFLPAGFDENQRYPALAVGHPFGGVKEQTSGLYAQKMAQSGYVTMAFDASFQGESEGEPRHLEDPDTRVEDVRCAVDYFTTLPFVDNARIGVIGVCAGGGYTFKATATDRRIKALATVSAADVGNAFRRGWGGDQTVETAAFPLLDNIAAVRTAEANGEAPLIVPVAPEQLSDELSQEWKDTYFYYRTDRGQHPRAVSRVPLVNFARILGFSAFSLADLVVQPVLFVAGSQAESLWQSRETFDALKAAGKELFIIDGANHIDLYDREPYVSQAVAKMSEFFAKHL